jgi:SNF2 family DNA or RNA helicase
MIELDPTRFKTPPFAHQMEGTKALVRHHAFALFDECGAGKSKQVVDAACALAVAGAIDTVVVVCPASVRCVWVDPELGEIKKHAWVSSSVFEFHAKVKNIWCDEDGDGIRWYVTNYEFLRSEARLAEFLKHVPKRTLLVLDESSYIKSRSALQTKAVAKLRQLCDRCVLLNGTPVTDSPLDLWAQLKVLDPKILGGHFRNYYHFRAHFAVMGGFKMHQVVKYVNLDKLSIMVAPYALRRLKADCLDLPEKLYTQREVALTPASWTRYRELRRDALITLGAEDVRLEPNSAVRILRLAQLTSGILGGQKLNVQQCSNPEFNGEFKTATQDLSSEKLDWCVKYLTEECAARAVIVWCRWRRERERLVKALDATAGTKFRVWQLYGGQPQRDREGAVSAFSFVGSRSDLERGILVAQPHAGGHGLNLVAATECIYLSNDFSLGIRLQSEDRCHRPGQTHSVLYTDVLATGPKGERTIDHHIVKALREKQDLAKWTCAKWRKELSDD